MNTEVTQEKYELPDEDQVLAFTHHKRKSILVDLMTDSTGQPSLPEDPAGQKVIVSLLKDMDAAALGRKRIKVDERVADGTAGAAALIAKVLGASLQAQHRQPVTNTPAREVPVLGAEVPRPPMVEGEMAVVGGASESYETFVARTGGADVSPASTTD